METYTGVPGKLFISQPMRDRTEEEIRKEREEIIKHCKEIYGDQLEPIDTYFDDEPVSKIPALVHLGRSIQMMAEADVAYFAKGWEEARGCKIENECAIAYGIEVREDYRK